MTDEGYNNHSEIDSLNVDELTESYKRYLNSLKRDMTEEENQKWRELMAQDEFGLLDDDV